MRVEDGKESKESPLDYPQAPSVTDGIATHLMHEQSKDRHVMTLMHMLLESIESACGRSERLRDCVTPDMDCLRHVSLHHAVWSNVCHSVCRSYSVALIGKPRFYFWLCIFWAAKLNRATDDMKSTRL
jgi:hypothetical protein